MNPSNEPLATLRRLILVQVCLLTIAAPLSWAQVAPMAAPDAASLAKYDKNKNGKLDDDELALKAADDAKAVPVEAKASDEAVVLSPFEVVSDSKGYYSSSTMSGTRFNSKLEDLASSITVVTKEQMADFAMLDLNDVFLYTASTEGTGNYTDLTVDRNGSVSDNVQLDPTQANRVRGIAPANLSLGNVETMGRTPVDTTVGVDALEISRGPNSTISGLGNPSGTVNSVAASANLQRDRTQVQIRGDSYDGYRSSLDLNRVLIKGILAVRGSAVFQHDGFVRKPSGVDTERYNGMIKFRPFPNTSISASTSYYHQYGVRPNFSPPRDSISYWVQSGKPTWDPVTSQVHLNGVTVGTFTNATGLPDYFQNTFTGNGHNYAFIDQNGLSYLTIPTGVSGTNPISGTQPARFMATSPASGATLGKIVSQPLFTTTPTITDKGIYDWSKINLASINRDWDRALTTTFQIDQKFFDTQRQSLFGQATFMREDSMRYRRDYIGIKNDNGQSGQLYIDVNERLLDGTPNPYFLRPYIGQDQPRTTYEPSKWDTYRAQLAYKLDLTHEQNLLKWLGLHQFTVYDEYKYRVSRRYSYREAILDAHPWIPISASRGNQGAITGGPGAALSITRSYLRYYLGDNQGLNVDYGPTDLKPGNYILNWGNSNGTGTIGTFNREPTQIGLAAVTDATGGGSNSKTILKTLGAVLQSHFLDERIVTTFGLRNDKQFQRAGSTPQQLNYPDGITFNYDSINHWSPTIKSGSGNTSQKSGVVRPFRGATFLNPLDQSGSIGHFFADTLRGLSLNYSKSDSFRPQDPKTDVFLRELPNPSGTGEEYGFGLNMLDGRLVVRFNHYDNRQLNKSGGDAGTIAQRVTRIDITSNAAFLLTTQARLWIAAVNPTFTTQQVDDEMARQIGVPLTQQNAIIQGFAAGTISSVQDIQATGNELEVNFNPSRFWTVAANASDTQSINSNVSTDINQWVAQRMPIWTTIVDQRFAADPVATQRLWWTHTGYGGSQTAQANYTSFVQTPFSVVRQLEGKSNPQIRRYAATVSSSYQLAGITEHAILKRFTIGGAVRWQDKGAIGYYGKQSLPAVITELDANRPIYDGAHYFIDARVSYRTKLWADKIGATFQLNVQNLQESGYLQPVAAFPDGTPNSYRIVDPRKFILTATFDL